MKTMPRKPIQRVKYTTEEMESMLQERVQLGSAEADAEKFSTVRQELMGSPEFADYPCRYCKRPDAMECSNICDLWTVWFSLHWSRITTEGKRIALQKHMREEKLALAKKHGNMSELYKELSGGKAILGSKGEAHDNE